MVVPCAAAEGQQAHDRASAHGLAAAGDRDVRVEVLDGLDEFGRGAGVQAPAVDDREFPIEAPSGTGAGGQSWSRGRSMGSFPGQDARGDVDVFAPGFLGVRHRVAPGASSSRTLASLISIGRLMPATTSTELPFMQDSARFEGVPPNMSVRTTTPLPELTRQTAAMMSLRRVSMSSSGPIVIVSSCS